MIPGPKSAAVIAREKMLLINKAKALALQEYRLVAQQAILNTHIELNPDDPRNATTQTKINQLESQLEKLKPQFITLFEQGVALVGEDEANRMRDDIITTIADEEREKLKVKAKPLLIQQFQLVAQIRSLPEADPKRKPLLIQEAKLKAQLREIENQALIGLNMFSQYKIQEFIRSVLHEQELIEEAKLVKQVKPLMVLSYKIHQQLAALEAKSSEPMTVAQKKTYELNKTKLSTQERKLEEQTHVIENRAIAVFGPEVVNMKKQALQAEIIQEQLASDAKLPPRKNK